MRLHQIHLLRRLVLPLLRRLNPGDVTIRHHWTGDPVRLHSFKHRNYWFLGRRRERDAMLLLAAIVRDGQHVIDVGGHIGYLTLYFAKLVGPSGRVTVFEPGPNNLPYIRRNVAARASVALVEMAVSDATGTATLFVEELTGQNNSLRADYRLFELAQESSGLREDTRAVQVACTTLDDYLERTGTADPHFVKIDIEGVEFEALQGMRRMLARANVALLIEITERFDEVFQFLSTLGFRMFRADRSEILSAADLSDATFCLKEGHPRLAEMTRRP